MEKEEIIGKLREMKEGRTYEVLAQELQVPFRSLFRWMKTGKMSNSWALILRARLRKLEEMHSCPLKGMRD